MNKPAPERPFQQIAADFGAYGGRQFLIIIDCKTGWPDIIDMGKDTTAPKLVATLRDQFCHTAALDLLWSDGGPQFTSAHLATFLQSWGVSHMTSSPHYPQSSRSSSKINEEAQLGRVDWSRLSRALLQYRNTPCRKDGLSPAQKLFGHPVQDNLPAHRRSFAPEWQKSSEEAEQAATLTQEKAKAFYNQHSRYLSGLQIGNHVAMQHPSTKLWDIYGTITEIGPHRRYLVTTQSCRVFSRNRRFLHKRSPQYSPVTDYPPNCSVPPANTATPPRTETRRSTRAKQAPQRLSEDPTWLFSSSTSKPEELGGEV